MNNLLPLNIQQYAEQYTTPPPNFLEELTRYTHLNTLQPNMLSGHLQGTFLQLISLLIKPQLVLEIGTFTGYSAICLCAGLQPNGKLHTIDINEEFNDIQSLFFEKANLKSQIIQHTGNALQIIPALPHHNFDLVFIDADKQNYLNYYELVLPKVKQGGLIIADNVLWKGKVTDLKAHTDKDTQAMHQFNEHVTNDLRTQNFLLPLRDGLMLAYKK